MADDEHGLNISSHSWLCKCGIFFCPKGAPPAKLRPAACPLHGAVLDCDVDCEGRSVDDRAAAERGRGIDPDAGATAIWPYRVTRAPAQERALAQRRLAGASRRYWAAHEVIERERRRISILTARIETGPGHVLTRDPDVNQPAFMYPYYAFCRYCGAPAGSIAGKDACAGDAHHCSAAVAEDATLTTFRIHAGLWLCGQPGTYDNAFTAWTCAAGHVTETVCEERRHVSGPPCACTGLVKVNPA